MTKKHYIKFAEEIKDKVLCSRQMTGNESCAALNEAEFAASVVCRIASRDNPRFDRSCFMSACGLD